MKRFSRLSAVTAIAGMLAMPAACVGQEANYSQEQLASILTLHNTNQMNTYLSSRFENFVRIAASSFSSPKSQSADEFDIAKFTKNGTYTKTITKKYPEYGNPLGVLQRGLLDFDADENRFFLTDFVVDSIQAYENGLTDLRHVNTELKLSASNYIDEYRLDSKLPKIDDKIYGTVPVISIGQPLGAITVKQIDLRGRINNGKSARVWFTFQPQGKKPLDCQSEIPYTYVEGKKAFLPMHTLLFCQFPDGVQQVMTSYQKQWEENKQYDKIHSMARHSGAIGGGFCGATCMAVGVDIDSPPYDKPGTSGKP